jgi:MinD superfamily P-loop ATPase
MQELVVISGKGGSGKTSLLASLAMLFQNQAVVVDCDVDAANLHLVLGPRVVHTVDFVGGSRASINAERCLKCGKCAELCRFDAIGRCDQQLDACYRVDMTACEGCGVCAHFCPNNAIDLLPTVDGQWFSSQSRCGPMIHARMNAGAENSGKMVTELRRQARHVARQDELDLILCDGSPGIGCPVIASMTGADWALIVAEPTLSGVHDFLRVAQLTRQMDVPSLLVVNKSSINSRLAKRLHREAAALDIESIGQVPYDPTVTQAQVAGRTIVEFSNGVAAQAIVQIWNKLVRMLQMNSSTTMCRGGAVGYNEVRCSCDYSP